MRTIAAITTTAAIALMGAANAQVTTPAPAATATSGDPLRSAVTAYAGYQMDLSDLRTRRVGDANALEGVIDTATHHNRDALSRGWIAYGAYTAAQSPAFNAGIRQAVQTYGRDNVIWALTAHSGYANTLPGAAEANRLVLNAANADGARIISVADRYQELAYSLQRQRWAMAVAPAQAARVQRVRSNNSAGWSGDLGDVGPRLAVSPMSLSITDPGVLGGRRFWDAVRGGAQVTEASATAVSYPRFRVDPPRGEAVYRMTTLAALHTLDATASHPAETSRILDEPRSRDCIEMAQLQLYQCFSAARFRYENAFCLGQHAMRDIGRCISAVAAPDTATMTPVAATAPSSSRR